MLAELGYHPRHLEAVGQYLRAIDAERTGNVKRRCPAVDQKALVLLHEIGSGLPNEGFDVGCAFEAVLERPWRRHPVHGSAMGLDDQSMAVQTAQIAPDGVLADLERLCQAAT